MGSYSLILLGGFIVTLSGMANGFSEINPIYAFTLDKDLIYREKLILEVVQHIYQQKIVLPSLYAEAEKFKFENYYDYFTNIDVVKEFVNFYKKGIVSNNEVFNVNSDDHRDQVIALFRVFYYAKDFDTFYKTVVWSRFYVNTELFLYALNVALFYRTDTIGIELPALYEIVPNYFFTAKTIQNAQSVKMQGFNDKNENKHNTVYYVDSNYTGVYFNNNEESRLSYFTEDIGLNSWYYYFNARFPFWLDRKEFVKFSVDQRRQGELFLFEHQQLLARYYLERLSNGFGDIPEFSFRDDIRTGYYSELRYYNGVSFPTRDNLRNVYVESNYYAIDKINDYERRIRDAIDNGFIILPDGSHVDLTKPDSIEFLGNLIHGSPDTYRNSFYGYFIILSKTILSGSFQNGNFNKPIVPGVLEHFQTALRDPLFYQLYKRIIKFYWQYKSLLPSYNVDEIKFDGVKIENVFIDKLVTYFDRFEVDLTNAVDTDVYYDLSANDRFDKASSFANLHKFNKINYEGNSYTIKTRPYRLNHKPFTFRLNVLSDRSVPSLIRVFFGPKHNEFGREFNLNENRQNFVLFDQFRYDLVSGNNVIERLSSNYVGYSNDFSTYFELYKKVMLALNDKFSMQFDNRDGLPNRLLLPKGTKDGKQFVFYFIVSPITGYFEENFTNVSRPYYRFVRNVDDRSFGYPLDRKINEAFWFSSNMYYQDVRVYHNTADLEVNKLDY